jgi:hypothetical protein
LEKTRIWNDPAAPALKHDTTNTATKAIHHLQHRPAAKSRGLDQQRAIDGLFVDFISGVISLNYAVLEAEFKENGRHC